jgi:hypothetical protein
MRRIALILLRGAWLVLLGAGLVPAASAQEHGQVGVYVDGFRLGQTKTNFAGLGGRFSVNSHRWLQFEAEMNYDFNQVFPESLVNTSTNAVFLQRSNLRILHGLFGPRLQAGHGPVRPFVTLKGGFINFRLDSLPATFATFASSVDNLRSQDVSGVVYPGAGLEGHLGPLGLRLDVGDEIYFNHGTHHNFRVAFGPILRF